MSGRTTVQKEHADIVYSILADAERRAIVRDLAANGASGRISELAQQVSEQRDRSFGWDGQAFRIRLRHQHLPKMADAGVVEHDRDTGRVTLTSMGEQVEAVRTQTAEVLRAE